MTDRLLQTRGGTEAPKSARSHRIDSRATAETEAQEGDDLSGDWEMVDEDELVDRKDWVFDSEGMKVPETLDLETAEIEQARKEWRAVFGI